MRQDRKIEYISELIDLGLDLMGTKTRTGDVRFVRWQGDVRSFLSRFAPTRQSDFDGVRFGLPIMTSSTRDHDIQAAFEAGLTRAMGVLDSIRNDFIVFDSDEASDLSHSAVDRVVRICRRFPRVARQLSSARRHSTRTGIDQADEYDVQDLLHALLLIDFDDVREEEWTPSYAGASARMDFLLKVDRLVIEVKRTRKGLGAKKAKEELAVDIDHYRTHPDCTTLVCFVFDPERLISNPAGFESDLEGQRTEQLDVRVVVAPHD